MLTLPWEALDSAWKCCFLQPLQPDLSPDRIPSPVMGDRDPFWFSRLEELKIVHYICLLRKDWIAA